jgi:uncharacterized protein YggE
VLRLRRTCAAFAAAIAIAIAGTQAARAASESAAAPPSPTVAVSGEGVVHAVPDLAVLETAVVTTAPDAAAALSRNSARTRTVMAAFRSAGIAERDIATTGFSVAPRYADDRHDSGPPRVTGYVVRNEVTVKVRDLSHLGAVLNAAVAQGANEVGQLSFTFADPDKLRDEARRKAVADARHRAALYAEAAGMTLGPILRLSETGGAAPPPRPVMMRMAAAASPVPIARGESEVRESVEVVWRLFPR